MTTKFCTDCKWCHNPRWWDRFLKDDSQAKCGRPELLDLVTGNPIVYCWSERNEVSSRLNSCGLEGIHYVERGL